MQIASVKCLMFDVHRQFTIFPKNVFTKIPRVRAVRLSKKSILANYFAYVLPNPVALCIVTPSVISLRKCHLPREGG